VTTYEEALAKVLAEARPLGEESVKLADALGRRTAGDLRAAHDSPIFDCSSVDGFAVRSADLQGAKQKGLSVVGTMYAGDDPAKARCGSGECVRTMTGAAIAEGADAVVMQEDVTSSGDTATFSQPAKHGQCVRKKGEEYREGDLLISAGTNCTPSVLALLAAQGHKTARVARRPLVAVLVTGEELARPGEKLKPGQIYDSNSIALASAVESLTGQRPHTASVGDDSATIMRALELSVNTCDLFVFSGGASVGEKDLVRAACLESGVEERFWRISMKPGKPVFFGVHMKGALVFALPGNPVSAQVTFEVLVAPAIRKMTGDPDPQPKRQRAVLGGCIQRNPGRLEFLRATTTYDNGKLIATPIQRQGSHMASGIAIADRLIVVPADKECIEAGETVDTIPLRWA
jgi:molybdopterin molybdotransferase